MKHVIPVILLGLSAAFGLWAEAADESYTEADLRAFLQEHEARVLPLSRASNLAYFKAAVSGNEADYEQAAQATIALKRIQSDHEAFKTIEGFRAAGQIVDPLLKRELEVLYLSYLGNQIDAQTLEELVRRESAVEQKFNTSRTKAGNRLLSDNQVDSILRHATSSTELEATWLASKAIGKEVAGEVIELARLRNRAAQSLGFTDFFQMQMRLNEQDASEVIALFDELDQLTREPFMKLKHQVDSTLARHYDVAVGDLRPWHYQNRFFQEAPQVYAVDVDGFYKGRDPVALARVYFAGIGLPVDSILARSDLYERPGKYQHAQCMDIDREGDVRAVCNVRPDYYWTNTMLHELGHGVYSYYNDKQLPWLLRDAAHSLTTEAVALLFGRLSMNPAWLKEVARIPPAEVDRAAAEMARTQRLEALVFSRWAQVVVRFEQAFYADPDRDLNRLWWDLVEDYQGLAPVPGRNEPDWAAKIHIATSPVYYHNYLLGELLASQLCHAIGQQVLDVPDPYRSSMSGDRRIGAYFAARVFRPGMRYPWNDLIQSATGEKLTARYYAQQFVND